MNYPDAPGYRCYLGPCDTEIEAAKARDQKALEFFGEFAWLDFPKGAGGQEPEDGGQTTEDRPTTRP